MDCFCIPEADLEHSGHGCTQSTERPSDDSLHICSATLETIATRTPASPFPEHQDGEGIDTIGIGAHCPGWALRRWSFWDIVSRKLPASHRLSRNHFRSTMIPQPGAVVVTTNLGTRTEGGPSAKYQGDCYLGPHQRRTPHRCSPTVRIQQQRAAPATFVSLAMDIVLHRL